MYKGNMATMQSMAATRDISVRITIVHNRKKGSVVPSSIGSTEPYIEKWINGAQFPPCLAWWYGKKDKNILNIGYNLLGKSTSIEFEDGRIMNYTYNAAGAKLKVEKYDGATLLSTTDYTGGYVYTNGALSFFSGPEGRIVKKGSTYERQYVITDHQGNTRVLFSSAAAAPEVFTANFEAADNTDFQNYPTGANRSSFDLFDHTDEGTTYTYSNLLNGGTSGQVGLSKSLKVYPGDKVKIEAFAKYYNEQATPTDLSGFAGALTSALHSLSKILDYVSQYWDIFFCGVFCIWCQCGRGSTGF